MTNYKQIKYNCDGALKGNPRENSYALCIKDHHGRLIWAETQRLGIATKNMLRPLLS